MLAALKEDLEGQMEDIEDQVGELELKLSNLKLLPQYPGNGEQAQREDFNTSQLSRNSGNTKKPRKSKAPKVAFEAQDKREDKPESKKRRH